MDPNALFIFVLIFIVIALCLASFLYTNKQRKKRESNISQNYFKRASSRKALSLNEMYFYFVGYAANKLSTENKTNATLYSQAGHLRADIKREISERKIVIQDFLTTNQVDFEKRLHARCLIDDYGNLLPENVNLVANELYCFYKERTIQLNKTALSDGISPSEFFKLKKEMHGDVVGAYILCNINKAKCYVGQSKRVYFRINQHFTGEGNPDVYADYKYGNNFRIKIIRLNDSGYYDLDKLEKDLISQYDAYNSGYNKNTGNGH